MCVFTGACECVGEVWSEISCAWLLSVETAPENGVCLGYRTQTHLISKHFDTVKNTHVFYLLHWDLTQPLSDIC